MDQRGAPFLDTINEDQAIRGSEGAAFLDTINEDEAVRGSERGTIFGYH